MDLGDDTLNGVAAAISSKNQVMGWNTGKLKSGLILLKIWYDGDSNNSGTFGHILDTYSSDFNPELSPTHKMRRNFFRAKAYRENSFKNKSLITTTSNPVQ